MTPEFFSAREWDVADGRLFTQEEVDGAAKVALIGQTVAGNLFGHSDPQKARARTARIRTTRC